MSWLCDTVTVSGEGIPAWMSNASHICTNQMPSLPSHTLLSRTGCLHLGTGFTKATTLTEKSSTSATVHNWPMLTERGPVDLMESKISKCPIWWGEVKPASCWGRCPNRVNQKPPASTSQLWLGQKSHVAGVITVGKADSWTPVFLFGLRVLVRFFPTLPQRVFGVNEVREESWSQRRVSRHKPQSC